MTTETLITHIYAAFNRRDITEALSFMSGTVSWPKASEGGRVVGPDEIRAYWTRQWSEFDPTVDPLEVLDKPDGRVHVRVHQVVKNLSGAILSDSEVWHVYTLRDGLIERMDLGEDEVGRGTPSAAFSGR